MLTLELATKALARSRSFSLIFIVNFALAIASLSYLQFFKGSIDASLESQAKTLLGADLVISSRFPITKEQIDAIQKKLPDIKKFNQGLSTVSMVSSTNRSRLMELVTLDKRFPYYGGFTFSDNTTYPDPAIEPNDNEVWVYQEVLDLLGLSEGESIKIGRTEFIISKVIVEDTLKAVSFSGFMPKVYLSKKALESTQLLQFGSTARYSLNYQFKEYFNNTRLEAIETQLKDHIPHNLRTLSPNDGRDRLLGVLTFLTNFLSLVSLVSLFLGLVGLIYLYSGFLRKHQKDITILYDLGLGRKQITSSYLLHLFSLILISTTIVFSLLLSTAYIAGPYLQQLLGIAFTFSLDYSFFFKAFLLLILISITIGIPLILPYILRRPYTIPQALLYFSPFVLILLFLAHSITPSKYIGFLFAFALLVLIAVLFIVVSFLFKKLDFSGYLTHLPLSLALKNITRERSTSLTLFTAILLSTMFFTLIPQVGASLSSALTKISQDRPRFFVIDAQESQINDLKTHIHSMGATLENISPMIRGRILKINDVNLLEEPTKYSLQNRAVNLSYRNELKQSEEIIVGRPFSREYNATDLSIPVEISVEKRYATRNGIELGDKILLDLLGVQIESIVVNIRTVNWTEFVPNFFFILQEGAIDDAPKTILATISSGEYDASKMLLSLTEYFPSLTVIDVKRLFETFADLVSRVTVITDRMSFYSVIVGLIMSFIIIQYQMNLQKNNILRLKMIGVKNHMIRYTFLIEYGLISCAASIIGILLGTLSSYIISYTLFEAYWEFRPLMLLSYLIIIPAMTLLIVTLFTSKIIYQKENTLFGE